MCEFFSAISNGKGRVLFFTLKDIHKITNDSNKDSLQWNSHSSIASFHGIKGEQEDKWNKWEYNPETKELKLDGELRTLDDRKDVLKEINKYLSKEGELYCHKIYKNNSGDSNSGDSNSGDSNSGNRNSGYSNSGDSNSGDSNSGNWNSGNRNSGYSNSGNWNSGNRNSGYLNTDTPKMRIFNKETNKKDILFPNYFYFDLNVWVSVSYMTDKEKEQFGWYKTTDGYLKKIDYKEAWKLSFERATKEDVAKTLKLPNFKYNLFEEISGITKQMIKEKLK